MMEKPHSSTSLWASFLAQKSARAMGHSATDYFGNNYAHTGRSHISIRSKTGGIPIVPS